MLILAAAGTFLQRQSGDLPAQIAGAALLTDYVLTVAVSISSGVAQLVSVYPISRVLPC